MENPQYLPLERLQPGSHGIVRRLEGGKGLASRLASLGLAVGSRVEVLENRGHGPLLVLVRDTRLALGRSEALKIVVEES
ncbi:MAG TPA: FeoA family protein [Candidatus Binatia bacterium]|jgi:Fe2+ transport system protein FeoA